jgi:prepilin-type N-terminal cleavage/methylation domain-containing protein
MRQAAEQTGAERRRDGFSIVEVLVALVLLTVGMLGIAGNCSLAVRVTGAAAHERRAAQRAADRIAELTSQGCVAARGGLITGDAAEFSERWTIGASGSSAALVDAEVRWASPSGERSVVLRSAILC